MTDRIAIGLAVVIFAAIGADMLFNDGIASLYMMRKMIDLVAYVSFWR